MTTIPDVMRSVSEVLTTAEDLLQDGEAEAVGHMVTSYLKTLLSDLDEVSVSQNAAALRSVGVNTSPTRKHMDCTKGNCLANLSSECPHYGDTISYPKVKATKKPVVNKFSGSCAKCGCKVNEQQGFVLPDVNQNAKKKWHTFCATHYKEVT